MYKVESMIFFKIQEKLLSQESGLKKLAEFLMHFKPNFIFGHFFLFNDIIITTN